MIEFGFSIIVGFRIRVVLKIWILCLIVVSLRFMGGIKARFKIWVRFKIKVLGLCLGFCLILRLGLRVKDQGSCFVFFRH